MRFGPVRAVSRASVFAIVWVVAAASLSAGGLPDPDPVFRMGRIGRSEPRLGVQTVAVPDISGTQHEMQPRPELRMGSKAVTVRWRDDAKRHPQDHVITIVVDGKAAAEIVFWGDDGQGAFGYPFQAIDESPARLTWDESAETIAYVKPYRTNSGVFASFTYTLRPIGAGRVELSWDCGDGQGEQKASEGNAGVGVWVSLTGYLADAVEIGGKPLAPTALPRLLEEKQVTRPVAGNLSYNPNDPLTGFDVEGEQLSGTALESLTELPNGDTSRFLQYRLQPAAGSLHGRVVIDLKQATIPDEAGSAPVGGIDFWGIDATHVPISPIRNLMPNPSFEQGLRYWTWMHGGAKYTKSATPRYSIVEEGLFGPNALAIRDVQKSSSGMMSFPLALDAGEPYTLSFHARAIADSTLTVSLASAAKGGRYRSPRGPWGDVENPDATFRVGRGWRRYSRTFNADSAGISIGLQADKTTLIDGIQLEKGDQPTAFVAPPLDGMLVTADSDNALQVGQEIDARLLCTGAPGTRGIAVVTAKNAFREQVYRGRGRITIGRSGVQSVPLPIDSRRLQEGVFVVEVAYDVPGFPVYTDYHRLAIIRPLSNRHPTKNICGTLGAYDSISRGEDLARRLMEWGFGSTSWGYDAAAPGERVDLENRYRIANIGNILQIKDPVGQDYMTWREVPDDLERRIEEAAFRHASRYDRRRDAVWAFGNEEEGSYLVSNGLFDEHLRVQLATARGVLRAIPDAIILPTCGTSGYSRLRGYDAMEGYLAAAQRVGWRYGGIAVHPYGNIDGGTLSMHDLDEETRRLIAQMERYGYGEETPIFYTEMFNVPETFIPSWNADSCYDDYSAGKPTYDFGNREFMQAASAARAIIIVAKYWPRVQSANLWVSRPFMDMRLTPLLLCKAINTIGNELDDVRFIADVKPSPRIRGYVFERADGTSVAAIWCIDKDVENGLAKGPRITIRTPQPLRFIDFMGCERQEVSGGDQPIGIPLTPAPLFIVGADAEALAQSLDGMDHDDAASPVRLTVAPNGSGGLSATLKNLTGRPAEGRVEVERQGTDYRLEPQAETSFEIACSPERSAAGELLHWSGTATVRIGNGTASARALEAVWFRVPRSRGVPDWDDISGVHVIGRFGGAGNAEPDAVLRMTWDDEYLRLCVDSSTTVESDQGGRDVPLGPVELFLDTAANGRANELLSLDKDDYRYDFLPNPSGGPIGSTTRVQGVNQQLADGTNMPTEADVAAQVRCEFRPMSRGCRMTIALPQRFILPVQLKAGASFGVGLVVSRPRSPGSENDVGGRTLAWEALGRPARQPSDWPTAVLMP